MRIFHRYRQLSGNERRLFFRALFWVVLIRLGLTILPFRVVQKRVDLLRQPAGSGRELDARSIRQVAWAVEAASRRVPKASCLTQGMATQVLLGKLGQRSELCLGVARKLDGEFEAHAWVETQGRIIIGGTVEGFHRFARLQKQGAQMV
jgi:hypothetical protein